MWVEICNVNGCPRPAVNTVAGWPKHKEAVHNYFHENGCPFCGSESHCLIDCVANKRLEDKLDRYLSGGPVV